MKSSYTINVVSLYLSLANCTALLYTKIDKVYEYFEASDLRRVNCDYIWYGVNSLRLSFSFNIFAELITNNQYHTYYAFCVFSIIRFICRIVWHEIFYITVCDENSEPFDKIIFFHLIGPYNIRYFIKTSIQSSYFLRVIIFIDCFL